MLVVLLGDHAWLDQSRIRSNNAIEPPGNQTAPTIVDSLGLHSRDISAGLRRRSAGPTERLDSVYSLPAPGFWGCSSALERRTATFSIWHRRERHQVLSRSCQDGLWIRQALHVLEYNRIHERTIRKLSRFCRESGSRE